MDLKRMEASLYALARQEGTTGLSVKTVMSMLIVRDERIAELLEFQQAVIREHLRDRARQRAQRNSTSNKRGSTSARISKG